MEYLLATLHSKTKVQIAMNIEFWRKRYTGKPFLRFLDFYVLDVIGQVTDKEHRMLRESQHKLLETFGGSGTWQDVVARQMDFETGFPNYVRSEWEKYLNLAKSDGRSVEPREFAVEFVDRIV